MVDGIRSSSEFARAAIDAARRNHERLARQLSEGLGGSVPAPPQSGAAAHSLSADAAGALDAARPGAPRFDQALGRGIARADDAVHAVDRMPADLITGEVTDLHEVAMRLKESEISYRFALEVRNKLIEAYREVMRMGV